MAKRGRPTKYNASMLEKAKAYYLKCYKGEKDPKTGKLIKRIPWIEELALELDLDDETVLEWTKDEDKKEFSATIKRIMTLQQLRLQQKSLQPYPTGSIFLLKVNHGKTEKIVIDDKTNDEKDDEITELQDIIHNIRSDATSQNNQSN